MDSATIYRRRWLILFSLVLSLVVVILDNTILNVALPSISRELGASQAQLTGAILSYAVVFGSLQFSAGVLGDRYGRLRILTMGLVIFGLFSLLASFAKNPTELIVFRALMAIGAAMVPPQTLSILTNVFPPEERGRAIGIWAGCTGAAIAIGPIIGGLLLDHFWWGSIFFINVPIVIVGLILARMFVPESKNPNPGKLDPIGIIMSALGLGALVFGLVYGGQYNNWSSVWSTGMILTGIAFIAGFVYYEAHSTHPSFDVRFFKNPRFSAASAANALAFFSLFGVTFFLTFYYQFVKGLSPFEAGLSVLPVAIAQVFFSPRAPKVVKRIGPKFTVAMGLTLLSISLFAYRFITVETPLWHVWIILFITGAGMAHVVAPATESVMSSLPREVAGAGSAVNNTTRQVAGSLGIAVFGTLLQVMYSKSIADSLDVLPAPYREEAGRSIGDTYVAVSNLAKVDPAAAGRAVQELGCQAGQACASGEAFISGVHLCAVVAGLVAAIAVGVVLKFLPRYSLAGGGIGGRPGGALGGPPAGGPTGGDGPNASKVAADSDHHEAVVDVTNPVAPTADPVTVAPPVRGESEE